MTSAKKSLIAAILALALLAPASAGAESLFNLYLGGGYAFVAPETHAFLAELDAYWFPDFRPEKVPLRYALSLDLRFLVYEDGLGGAVAAGLSLFYLPHDDPWVNEFYLRLGVVPMDDVTFYGELGWAYHPIPFAFNLGMAWFLDTIVLKASAGVYF